MKQWLEDLLAAEEKGTMPILSIPSVSLPDVSVRQLIADSDLHAWGMELVAGYQRWPASV